MARSIELCVTARPFGVATSAALVGCWCASSMNNIEKGPHSRRARFAVLRWVSPRSVVVNVSLSSSGMFYRRRRKSQAEVTGGGPPRHTVPSVAVARR